jgi:hypothetical protein
MGCDLSAQIPSASGLSPPAPSSARSLNRSGSRRPRPAFQQGHSSAAGAVAPVHRHPACRVRQPGLVSSRESRASRERRRDCCNGRSRPVHPAGSLVAHCDHADPRPRGGTARHFGYAPRSIGGQGGPTRFWREGGLQPTLGCASAFPPASALRGRAPSPTRPCF